MVVIYFDYFFVPPIMPNISSFAQQNIYLLSHIKECPIEKIGSNGLYRRVMTRRELKFRIASLVF